MTSLVTMTQLDAMTQLTVVTMTQLDAMTQLSANDPA
jgi:hypothetical protein